MTEITNNAAVSALLETAETYDGCQSLHSESERTQTGERPRLACICHVGDACRIMSTAWHTINKDPRGSFIIVPAYEVQLKEAYCRHLRPNCTSEEIDHIDDFVVAVHHFHPTIIDRCFNTEHDERPEENVLPMPARTIASTLALKYLLDDRDRVLCHQTGAATGGYWVVPSYSFDSAHGDLKESMGNMPQLDLERCVRRMKREARRQKWEAIVEKWEAVSRRSSFRSVRSEMTSVTDTIPVLNIPPANMIIGNETEMHDPHSYPPRFILQTSAPSPGYATNYIPSNKQLLGKGAIEMRHECSSFGSDLQVKDDLEQVRRGSLMTAQEVLESELGDDDTILDLNDEDEPEWPKPSVQTKNLAEQRQDASIFAGLTAAIPPEQAAMESESIKYDVVPDLNKIDEQDSSESEAQTSSSSEAKQVDPDATQNKGTKETFPQPQDDASLSSLSHEGSANNDSELKVEINVAGQLQSKLGAPEKATPVKKPLLPQVVKKNEDSRHHHLSPPFHTMLELPSAAWLTIRETHGHARSFLKSGIATVIVVAAFCIYIVSMIVRVIECKQILRSREIGFM